MTPPTKVLEAAKVLDVPADEIVDVEDSPAGLVITTKPNTRYVVVPDDQPDADGKTGLMLLVAPHENWGGSYPVYAQRTEDDEPTDSDGIAADDVGGPDGSTIKAILAWVAGDAARAQKALDDENEQDDPRSTLVAELEAILAQADAQPTEDDEDQDVDEDDD